ncbi:GH116 family glycosyl-hydrolase [Paraglaciecola sp.]|uniref:GH116 family glycosyl-hydrolase n=1 Tax=Paraglaciecola sp. TaxID=1920173 RepID=UPI003EF1EC78
MRTNVSHLFGGLVILLGVSACQKKDTNLLIPAQTNDQIMTQLTLDPNGKTETVKNFPASFPQVLTKRGEPLTYNKQNSSNFEYIGMPIGGIGAGQLYLGGDGQLWFWDIFGLNYYHGSHKGEEAYEFPYNRSDANQKGVYTPEQGFAVRVKQNGEWVEKTLNRDGFDDITFLGQYPIGEVSYRAQDLPVDIDLEAFSPFVPLALEKSMYPATVLNYTLSNTSDKPIEVELNGWLENTILHQSRLSSNKLNIAGKLKNQAEIINNEAARITYSAELSQGQTQIKDLLDYGTLSLTAFGGEVSVDKAYQEVDLQTKTQLTSTLSQAFTIQPGEQKTASFILSWHFKNTHKVHLLPYNMADKKVLMKKSENTYARMYKDSADVADHILKNYAQLSSQTRQWRDTWYDSTLPYWFLDRTFLNASILASTTSTIIDDFLFYGTEGNNQGSGTVTHVWGYAKAMGRLFPRLEKSLREQVDYVPVSKGGSLNDNGMIRYRWLADKLEEAVDGQAGVILRTFMSHQMSKNDAFLQRVYPGVKKAMQGLTAHNDADHDGILTGPQHNTLDGIWYGKVTWLSLHYTAALRATAEMAKEVGDHEYAEFCLTLANKGRDYIENNLFNGEYFIHEADPEHPESPGTYSGLEYSQLLGQSWAYHVGLGEILDSNKVKTALESMWRYNFTTDVGPFREKFTAGRWYAMPGEGGMLACTWPNGGQDVLGKGNQRFAAYNNESQNGYEYAATSLMMWHDMPYQSLAHIWYMHNDRYHGEKRNPWCEVEWGGHYARSMASYGHFTAVSGYEYHGPKGYLAFAPKITKDNFKSAFTVAQGWGSFAQIQTTNQQIETIELKYGSLTLKQLAFEFPAKLETSSFSFNGQELDYQIEQSSNKVTINLKEKVTLSANDAITITLKAGS